MPKKLFSILMLVVLAVSTLTAPAIAASDDPVMAQVYFTSTDQLAQLVSRLDVWESHPDQGYVAAYLYPQDLKWLAEAGYRVEVDEAWTSKVNAPRVIPDNQLTGIPGYTCYRTVEENITSLQTLNTTYPNLVDLADIGNSWEKRTIGGAPGYDIWRLRLTNEAIAGPKPIFFLMAEVHAREYTTSEMAMRFAEYLLQNYGTNADVTWMLDNYELHLVPMTNPDGRKNAEAGELWRKNTNNMNGCTTFPDYGTDLNRNAPWHWGGEGASTYACDETYRGSSAGSESENQAIINYVTGIFPDLRDDAVSDAAPLDYQGLFITLHSYSGLVLWPWGDSYSAAPNGTQLATLGRKMAYFNNYDPQQSVELYPTTGSTDDWAYGTLGVPGYTFEMGTEFFQSCSTFTNTIYPANLNALLYAFKSARRPYQTAAGPEVVTPAVNQSAVRPGTAVTLTASANDTRYRSGTGEPTQNIAEAWYTIDQPSWVEGTVKYPMSAADGSFNAKTENVTASINTGALSAGRHIIYVESKDVAGNTGVPSAVFLNILGVSASDSSMGGLTSDVLTHTVTITNSTGITNTFDLALSTPGWDAQLSASTVGPLVNGASAQVAVLVTLPADPQGVLTETRILNVTSQFGSPAFTTQAEITSTILAGDPSLSITHFDQAAAPGTVLSYPIQISNSGSITDTFTLTAENDHSWVVDLPETSVGPLAPAASTTVTVTVAVPADAQPFASANTIFTASPASMPSIERQLTLVSRATGYDLSVSTPAAEQGGRSGAVLTFPVTITNLSNVPDSFALTLTPTAGWVAELESDSTGVLAPGASAILNLTVRVPAGFPSQNQAVTVLRVTSAGSSDSRDLSVTARLDWSVFLPAVVR